MWTWITFAVVLVAGTIALVIMVIRAAREYKRQFPDDKRR